MRPETINATIEKWTQREIEVLVLIATGASAKQVGLVLGIQAKTARNHVERIYAKCGVSTPAKVFSCWVRSSRRNGSILGTSSPFDV